MLPKPTKTIEVQDNYEIYSPDLPTTTTRAYDICKACLMFFYKCHNCKSYFPSGTSAPYQDDISEQTVEGEIYCKQCFSDLFVECDDCYKILDRRKPETIVQVETRRLSIVVCQACYEQNYNISCYNCNKAYPVDDAVYDDVTDNILCADCYDELTDDREKIAEKIKEIDSTGKAIAESIWYCENQIYREGIISNNDVEFLDEITNKLNSILGEIEKR